MSINISVVVPTYNRADLIHKTLDAIVSQSYSPEEVIVVDDGSQDNTEEVVRSFAPLVRYLRIENSGECRARNVGVSLARCEYIAFCDSDDLWRPDKLKLQTRIFEDAPECDYSFTNFKIVVDDSWSSETKFDSLPHHYFDLPQHQLDKDLFVIKTPMFDRLLGNQPIFPSTLMMKKSFFESVGRWNEPLGRTPSVDLEFHLRCVGRPNIGVVSRPVVGIRKHDSNFSGQPLKLAMGEIAVLRYVLANNPQAIAYTEVIENQIAIRNAFLAADAFGSGDLESARKFLAGVPYNRRSQKLKVKSIILQCPDSVGHSLRKIGIYIAQHLHHHHLS